MSTGLIILLVIVHLLLVYPVYLYAKWFQLYDLETKQYIGKWKYADFYITMTLCFCVWEIVLPIIAIINLIEYVENKWSQEYPEHINKM